MESHILISTLGVTVLLAAFIMQQLKWIESSSNLYTFLNFFGALLSAWGSFLIEFWPFVILECTWSTISLVSLIKNLASVQMQWGKLKLSKA